MLTPEQQKQIREYVYELDNQSASFTGLRRLAVRLGLDPLYHSTVGGIRYIRHRLAGKPVYTDVLEAAMQTDYILTDTVEKATPQTRIRESTMSEVEQRSGGEYTTADEAIARLSRQ